MKVKHNEKITIEIDDSLFCEKHPEESQIIIKTAGKAYRNICSVCNPKAYKKENEQS